MPAADSNSESGRDHQFKQLLLGWYDRNARSLPWRDPVTPYRTWASEIMLQQTRVDTVIPYFLRWMERFPTVEALAQASEQEVLQMWEGLGYYSRARNLHKAAQTVQNAYGGQLPHTAEGLQKLPGIGKYTAGAISSIAFGEVQIALDGNLKRVIARTDAIALPVQSKEAEQEIRRILERRIDHYRPGDFNQALMDLGATVCLPANPLCSVCPLNSVCAAYAQGKQNEYPQMVKKPAVPHYNVAAAVIWRAGRVLIVQRPADKLLGSLWEFPGGKQEAGETLQECLVREIREELGAEVSVGDAVGRYKHAYTHFKVTLTAFHCTLTGDGEPQPIEAQDLRWVLVCELADFPMGKLDRLIARQLNA